MADVPTAAQVLNRLWDLPEPYPKVRRLGAIHRELKAQREQLIDNPYR